MEGGASYERGALDATLPASRASAPGAGKLAQCRSPQRAAVAPVRAAAAHTRVHTMPQGPVRKLPMRWQRGLKWSRSSVSRGAAARPSQTHSQQLAATAAAAATPWPRTTTHLPPLAARGCGAKPITASRPAARSVLRPCARHPHSRFSPAPIRPKPPGRGAYGSVYKAVDRVTRRFVAIKIITLMDSDPQVRAKGSRGPQAHPAPQPAGLRPAAAPAAEAAAASRRGAARSAQVQSRSCSALP